MSMAEMRPFTGRKFLAILIGAFLLVSGVNGLMIWFALHSWTGLVSDSAYQDGLGFDRVLAESRAEAALGWSARISYDAASGRLLAVLADADGRSLTGMKLSVDWLRPTSEGLDRTVTLTERAGGRYEVAFRPPLPGQWDLRLRVSDRGQVRFHAETRILVSP
jgi:nitrogen fixation protein FixH